MIRGSHRAAKRSTICRWIECKSRQYLLAARGVPSGAGAIQSPSIFNSDGIAKQTNGVDGQLDRRSQVRGEEAGRANLRSIASRPS